MEVILAISTRGRRYLIYPTYDIFGLILLVWNLIVILCEVKVVMLLKSRIVCVNPR